jgi:hypothetical protein
MVMVMAGITLLRSPHASTEAILHFSMFPDCLDCAEHPPHSPRVTALVDECL